MTEQQIYNLRWKLPDLIFFIMREWGSSEVLKAFNISVHEQEILVGFLAGEEFPTDEQLKGFCDRFKFSYSTLKTWNVMHLIKENK